MRIVNERPPMWEAAKEKFNLKDDQEIYFTYGDALYNPIGKEVRDDIIRHEETHEEQQGMYPGGPEAWWKEYMVNPEFLVSQEVEAYAVQWKFLCAKFKDRNRQMRILVDISRILGGPIYGNVISPSEAMKMIQELCTIGERGDE